MLQIRPNKKISVFQVIGLPAIHFSVDLIFLSFVIMGFIVELWNY